MTRRAVTTDELGRELALLRAQADVATGGRTAAIRAARNRQRREPPNISVPAFR